MSQSEDFAWSITFACMMTDFQNTLISRIYSVFWSSFCTEQLEMICRMDFDMFLEFYFFCRMDFDMFFEILVFEPK